jgi:hypothetical protein
MKTKTIDSYIASVIEESLKATLQKRALQEKEKQDATSGEKPEEEKDATGEQVKKLKKGDITVEDIIEKLNSIRSGKSFNDDDVKAALTKYFDGLEGAEQVVLSVFLKGISQIVTGEVSAAQAVEPGDEPVDIEIKKTSGPQKVSVKPNVIKAPDIDKNKKPSAEDASGPVPITPKKK